MKKNNTGLHFIHTPSKKMMFKKQPSVFLLFSPENKYHRRVRVLVIKFTFGTFETNRTIRNRECTHCLEFFELFRLFPNFRKSTLPVLVSFLISWIWIKNESPDPTSQLFLVNILIEHGHRVNIAQAACPGSIISHMSSWIKLPNPAESKHSQSV